jgi:hypothetical protein
VGAGGFGFGVGVGRVVGRGVTRGAFVAAGLGVLGAAVGFGVVATVVGWPEATTGGGVELAPSGPTGPAASALAGGPTGLPPGRLVWASTSPRASPVACGTTATTIASTARTRTARIPESRR